MCGEGETIVYTDITYDTPRPEETWFLLTKYLFPVLAELLQLHLRDLSDSF